MTLEVERNHYGDYCEADSVQNVVDSGVADRECVVVVQTQEMPGHQLRLGN